MDLSEADSGDGDDGDDCVDLASTICRDVRQQTPTRPGLATMIAIALAREVATFSL